MDSGKMQEMLAAAQQMQQQMEDKLAQTVVEGSSGGGAITVQMNGRKQVLRVRITRCDGRPGSKRCGPRDAGGPDRGCSQRCRTPGGSGSAVRCLGHAGRAWFTARTVLGAARLAFRISGLEAGHGVRCAGERLAVHALVFCRLIGNRGTAGFLDRAAVP